MRLKGLVVITIPLVALVVAALSVNVAQEKHDEEQEALQQAWEVSSQVRTVLILLLDAETGVRGFKLTGRPGFITPYREAFVRLPGALASLEKLAGADPAQAARARRVRFLVGRQLETLARLRNDGDVEAAEDAIREEERVMRSLRRELNAMIDAEEELRDEHLDAVEVSRRDEGVVLLGAVITGLAGGLLAMILFTTGISHRIARLGESARMLAEGSPLPERPEGTDELGRLGNELGNAAHLLADREARLLEAKERAEQASWAKSDFLSRTSHELRTPLSAIVGFAHLMKKGALPPDAEADAVDRIAQAGDYLSRLLNDVLDIGLVEAGYLSVSKESVAVSELMTECCGLMQHAADEAGVTLEIEPGGCEDVTAAADAHRLRGILLNLLSNGIKYNDRGGSVRMSCSHGDDRVAIEVRDDGSGIAADKLEQLFTPYERLGAEKTAVRGVGLGLAVSKSLVELMEGTLEVVSEEGIGSTFTVRLPMWEGSKSTTTEPLHQA